MNPIPLNHNNLNSELIIGLVCAVGTETSQVIELLNERLGLAGYRVITIKVSRDIIPLLIDIEETDSQYDRYDRLMKAGNYCRGLHDDGSQSDDSVLALGVAAHIFALRSNSNSNSDSLDNSKGPHPLEKTAFIIDSVKRPEEVDKLRSIYPSGFVLIGIHADESRRRSHLIDNLGMSDDQARELIERDSEEIEIDHGQRVNETFHLADFFIKVCDNRDTLRCDITRLVELWFGNPFLTPTFDEYAMFLAFSAGLRSADLSRQVGAVVTKDRQVLSTGANECPRSGGGLYWASRSESNSNCIGDEPNGRDYRRKEGDSNRAEQNRIIDLIVKGIKEKLPELTNCDALTEVLRNSPLRDLTEFGRVVHAEMEALLSCSRQGVSTIGTTLYSTTFPCHNCAKHIVAAGVKKVVFVEPYSKSKAMKFHDDSIVHADENADNRQGKVIFEPFVGVGPRRFFEIFSMNLGSSYALKRKDKDTGKPIDWRITKADLRLQMRPYSYLELEAIATIQFGKKQKYAKDRSES